MVSNPRFVVCLFVLMCRGGILTCWLWGVNLVCARVSTDKLLTGFHLGANHVMNGLVRKSKEQRCKLCQMMITGFYITSIFARCGKICAWLFVDVVA